MDGKPPSESTPPNVPSFFAPENPWHAGHVMPIISTSSTRPLSDASDVVRPV